MRTKGNVRGMARHLFEYINFDQQCIVDFRLYPWADQYLMNEFRRHCQRRMSLIHCDNLQKIILHERVVELRGVGYNYPTIASQLGISVGAAWSYA